MEKIQKNLWIGDIIDAQRGDTNRFDKVITVCQNSVRDNIGCEYSHFELADGEPPEDAFDPGEFSYDKFREATEEIIESLKNNKKTFVHCHAGKSRSVMTCTAAIAVMNNISYEEAYSKVRKVRSTNPTKEMTEFARKFIKSQN